MASNAGALNRALERVKGTYDNVAEMVFGKRKDGKANCISLDGYKVPEKLHDAIKKSYNRDMEPFRTQAKDAIAQYAGQYGNRFAGAQTLPDVIVNKIQQYVRTYMRLFASGTPQALVTTDYKDLKPFAETFQLGLNRRFKEIKLGDSFSLAVCSSFFGPGVMKTGIADGGEGFEIDGVFYDPGVAFSCPISIDNFVMDMEAETLADMSFIGDRYRRPRHWIEKLTKNKNGMDGVEKRDMSDMAPDGRISDVDEDPGSDLYDLIWCWDIYLPKQNLVVMFMDGNPDPIMAYEWDGPEGGPYDILQYDKVPGESMPIAPTSSLLPLHNWINSLARKLRNQTQRQKTVGLYNKGDEEDARTIKNASDGEMVGVNNPDTVNEFVLGGANAGNFNMEVYLDGIFDIQGGNLEAIAGLGPQSETFKQDQLLHQSANTQVEAMRMAVLEFYSNIIKKHAWYLWVDQLHGDMELYKTIPGTQLIAPTTLSAEIREGDFIQYNFDINPHSISEDTPTDKSQKLMALWNNVVMPNAQLAMQAGYMPNVVEFVNEIAELQAVSADKLFIASDPSMEQGNPGQVPQPQGTHSIYERRSTPGQTPAGNRAAVMAANSGMDSPNQMGQQFQKMG